ncbi:hypothetical protein [Paraglaciecola sp. 20A4]|uniref:hypothetical protein n=1 Tax=Paraglaciecola sp. 20A4 TaxID=2687288 RepID=UPI0014083CD1|nr:hypothetical protein [Paraglaciecola sp. 20A4]
MKIQLLIASTLIVTSLTGCVSQQKPCEDILEVKRQEQQCTEWRKTMGNKQYPQQALTAKKRYEEACVNLRYYRDGYDTICKGQDKAIGEKKE